MKWMISRGLHTAFIWVDLPYKHHIQRSFYEIVFFNIVSALLNKIKQNYVINHNPNI